MILSATFTANATSVPQGMRLWVPGTCGRSILSFSTYAKNHGELDPNHEVSGQTNSV